jgi:hypothetical protein
LKIRSAGHSDTWSAYQFFKLRGVRIQAKPSELLGTPTPVGTHAGYTFIL